MKRVNTTEIRRSKRQSESEESSYASSEEEKEKRRKMQVTKEHQITQVTERYANIDLRLVILPIKEMKKCRINLLLDTGATLTLNKGPKRRDTYTRKANGPHRRDRLSSKDNRKNKSHGAFRRQGNSTYHACREK